MPSLMATTVSQGEGHRGRRKQRHAGAAGNDSMHVDSKRWQGGYSSNKEVSAFWGDSRIWASQKIP